MGFVVPRVWMNAVSVMVLAWFTTAAVSRSRRAIVIATEIKKMLAVTVVGMVHNIIVRTMAYVHPLGIWYVVPRIVKLVNAVMVW